MTLFKLPKNQHKSMRKLDHDQKALTMKSYDFVSNPPTPPPPPKKKKKKKKKTKDEVSFRMKSQTLKSKYTFDKVSHFKPQVNKKIRIF